MTLRPLFHLPRRADRSLFPAAVAGLLALALILQLALPHGVDLPEPDVLRPFRADDPKPTPITADPAMVARPLLDPLRGASGPAQGNAGGQPLGGAVAAGLARRGGRTTAFVQAPDGSVTQLAVGATYEGWRLIAAAPAGLIFAQGGKTLTLPFTPQPGAPR